MKQPALPRCLDLITGFAFSFSGCGKFNSTAPDNKKIHYLIVQLIQMQAGPGLINSEATKVTEDLGSFDIFPLLFRTSWLCLKFF